MPGPPTAPSTTEFELFSRYLVGRVAPAAFSARYAAGCLALFGEAAAPSGALDLALRRPWTLPFLDAACGLVRRDDPLRKRLLLLTAILEASPDFAAEFLPRRLTWPMLLLALPWWSASSVFRAAIGFGLLKTAARARPS